MCGGGAEIVGGAELASPLTGPMSANSSDMVPRDIIATQKDIGRPPNLDLDNDLGTMGS